GEAAPLLAQYNQNVANQTGAAGNLYNAAGQTATALGGNQAQGLNFASAIPTLAAQGPSGILQAQAAARGLPLNNLGMLENLTVPIAGLGGQQSGTSNSQGTNTMSGAQQFALIAGGLGSLFSGGGNAAAGAAKFSDRRAKTNIERIGTLFDGTPVYRYRYIGTRKPIEIGIMADEVTPEAITSIAPYGAQAVNIELATNKAAEMGRDNGPL
ncbi:MAG TPA: tail fiber domain-containing protein, partial [Candidatus Angelobacter sp.]|nr:tail fiber domain-containing protein [Candidatus Angelobacter sp.]